MVLFFASKAAVRRGSPNRVVDEVARLVFHGKGHGHDRLDHGANRTWQFGVLRRNIAGSGDGSAAPWPSTTTSGRRAELRCAVFDGAERRGVDQVSSIAGDKQLSEAEAAEQQLRRYAAIGAAHDDSPWRLRLGNAFSRFGEIRRARLGTLDVTPVALLQCVQRLIRRHSRAGAVVTGCSGGCGVLAKCMCHTLPSYSSTS